MTSDFLPEADPLVVPDLDVLVDRYAPELRGGPAIDRVSAYFALAWSGLLVGLAGYNVGGILAGVIVGVIVTLAGIVGFERYRIRVHRTFEEDMRERPWRLYGAIADRFRQDLSHQRARLMGPTSQWGRARSPLQEAHQEARRSVAYWRERQAQDADRSAIRDNLNTAERLAGKFEAALRELDGRSEILLDFFNACEAKLTALEYSQRDVEESRRLASLRDRAEDVTYDAREAIAGIGRDVLQQALEVGAALGAAERFRIQHGAGDVPVDELEAVADRILASAESERRALSALASAVDAAEP